MKVFVHLQGRGMFAHIHIWDGCVNGGCQGRSFHQIQISYMKSTVGLLGAAHRTNPHIFHVLLLTRAQVRAYESYMLLAASITFSTHMEALLELVR